MPIWIFDQSSFGNGSLRSSASAFSLMIIQGLSVHVAGNLTNIKHIIHSKHVIQEKNQPASEVNYQSIFSLKPSPPPKKKKNRCWPPDQPVMPKPRPHAIARLQEMDASKNGFAIQLPKNKHTPLKTNMTIGTTPLPVTVANKGL